MTDTVSGRVPPHDLDAEAVILSAVLMYGGAALDRVIDILAPEHFYSRDNGWIFEAAVAVADTGSTVNVASVADHLRAHGRWEQVGGYPYLKQLADEIPFVHHLEARGRVVLDMWKLRQLIATCQRFAAEGYGDVGDVGEFIGAAEASILHISGTAEGEEISTMGEAIVDRVAGIVASDGKPTNTITTGLHDVDQLMGPIAPGALVLIGAHSGVGKTSLAMQIGLHVVARCTIDQHGAAALVVSQEMTKQELADRALSGAVSLDTRSIAAGRLDARALSQVTGMAERLRTGPSALHALWIDDRPAVKPSQLRQRARGVASAARRSGLKLALVIVDYVQLMDGSDDAKRSHERYEREVAYVSKELKKLAKELKCVVLALAQLNEDARTEGRMPRGEDLSQCKALRHDADRVLLLHNEAALARRLADHDDEADGRDLPPEVVQIIVDKNRGGREGLRHVIFQPSRSSFSDMEPADRRRYVEERARNRAEQAKGGRRR